MGEGTRRTSDGSPVPFSMALEEWSAATRPILVGLAHTYGAYITYSSLRDRLFAATGVATDSLLQNWIGKVLYRVASDPSEPDEPILTALVVRADETIGPGFAGPVLERYGVVPEDLDQFAADERLRCYRHFGSDMPPGGGVPQLTPKVARSRHRQRAMPTRSRCPSCFLELPASGRCDTCDG